MYYGRKAEPKANKLLHDAEIRYRQELHRSRLKNAKPTIDRTEPKGFGKVRRNLKREQQLEDRYAQIEHENRLLLSRMTEIMQKSTLDNKSEAWKYGKSLNLGARKRELAKIAQENEKILERIRNVEPSYNHLEWEQEALEAEKLVENISEFKARPIGQTTSLLRRSRIENAPAPNSPRKHGHNNSMYNMDSNSIDALNAQMSVRDFHEGSMSYGPPGGYGLAGSYGQAGGYGQHNPYASYENVNPNAAHPYSQYPPAGGAYHSAASFSAGVSTSLPPVAGVHGAHSAPHTSMLGSIPYGYGHVPQGGAGIPSMYAPQQQPYSMGGGVGAYANPSADYGAGRMALHPAPKSM